MLRPLPIRRFIARQITVVTILPVALIVILIWLVLLPQVRTSIDLQQQSLARTVAGEILAHLMGGERQLVALADVILAEKGLTPAQLTPLLDAGCGEGELFETTYLVGEASHTIDHIGLARPGRSRRDDLLNIDLSGRDLFKTAFREVRTAWSKTFLSTVSSHLAVALAVPLPGRVIIGEITLDRLSKYISQLPVEAELLILVIDRHGRIVADSQQKRWGQQLDLATLTPNKKDRSASRPLFLDGVHMVASMVNVQRLGWQVLVAQSQSAVYKDVRAMLLLAAVGLVVVMIVSLAVTWFMAKRLQKIVGVFTAHAKSIAQGHYDLQWPKARSIKYHELGENLRSMARQIRQRERQLRENERLLQELTANVPGVVFQFRTTPAHVYTSEFLSAKAIEIFRLEPNPATFIDEFYKQIPDDEKDRYLSSVREAVDTVSPWSYEGRFIRPDGETIWFSGHAVPRREGEDLVFYGVLLDITQRKQAEEAVRHLRNYLSNIINSMPSVLVGVDSQGRVTQWNQQAKRVTGLTLAEVRQKPLEMVFTPLAEVVDQIQAAIRDRRVIRKLKVPRQREDKLCYEDIIIFPLEANGAQGAVIRVDDVTERVRLEEMMIQSEKMLSVGGLAAGMAHEINNPLAGILQNTDVLKNRLLKDLPANRKAADAAGITLASLMKKRYDFKKIRINREYEPADMHVPCEASKIQQVFLNLLKNGAEAMSGIGATNPRKEKHQSPQFTIRAKAEAQWVQVEIEDNGPGIDEKTRRSIFEPFFTTKPVGKGTGLGLSVSYFIVTEDHGGEMEVQSSPDGGARFVIRLPRSGQTRASEA